MERWIVKYSSGSEANATSPSQAKNFAHCDKKATIHHLVEAREKVWVVRNGRGVFVAADILGSHEAWRSARDLVHDQAMTVAEFSCARKAEGFTCREEWLGGGE